MIDLEFLYIWEKTSLDVTESLIIVVVVIITLLSVYCKFQHNYPGIHPTNHEA